MDEDRKELYSQLMEVIPGPVLVYKDEKEEPIIFINNEMLNLFECSSEEEFCEKVGNSFIDTVRIDEYASVHNSIQSSKDMKIIYVRHHIVTAKENIKYVESAVYPMHHPKLGNLLFTYMNDISIHDNLDFCNDAGNSFGLMNVLRNTFEIYRSLFIWDLKKDRVDSILMVEQARKFNLRNSSIRTVVNNYGAIYVYEKDLDRYLDFMDPDTVTDRLKQSKKRYLTCLIRCRNLNMEFMWNLFVLIPREEEIIRHVLVGMVEISGVNQLGEIEAFGLNEEEMGTSVDLPEPLLWDRIWNSTEGIPSDIILDNILNLPTLGIFWKDNQRRFRGVNEAFLRYYGLSSAEEVIGRTDEDMGWHVDPSPFMFDEIRLLQKGEFIRNVKGSCIVHGTIRTISASKKPMYYKGKIVGLVGYFTDITEQSEAKKRWRQVAEVDEVTGILNRRGLSKVLSKYKNSYNQLQMDFAMYYLEVSEFQKISETYGHEVGDRVLIFFSSELGKIIGKNCTVCRFDGGTFIILRQFSVPKDVDELAADLIRFTEEIDKVGEFPCQLKAYMGIALFSEFQDTRKMMRVAEERMIRNKIDGGLG